GYHRQPGTPHAEAVAILRAGKDAEGGTLYINLEPCVHFGRTPPCVDTLIQTQLKRVVISAADPNPVVYTKGIQSLRQVGIDVSVGLLEEKNARLNEIYIKFITKKIPFLTAKVASSLDGKIATKNGTSRWISSPATRQYIHQLRGEHDAIMVGINTILQDDPLLTVRHPDWDKKSLTRVILDSKLRFPTKSRMFDTLSRGDIFIFSGIDASAAKEQELRDKGARVFRVPHSDTGLDLEAVLATLGEEEIASVLVEGGGRTLTALLDRRLIDKIYATLSPKLIGGDSAPSFYRGEGVESVEHALRLNRIHSFNIGEDIIVEGYC
ncbi:bifunctional diaminohydroxyphosphoribosylaminopyrimidine deaminase/5-amino-6-(5-phosphoribosylamino)uracil reductase RibD, partial [Acidobacteriota bacterium]